MRETLYIRLREPAPESATPFRVDGTAPGGTRTARLAEVVAECAGRRVVVFAPGGDVRLAQVAVPARQAARALQAVPYALEEQFAEDVDSLHFALGSRGADGLWPVAAIARARMQALLAPFRSQGARIDLLLPETLCLPLPAEGRLSVLLEAQQATVRSAPYGGFVCAPSDLATYLDFADPERGRGLQVITPREVEHDLTALGRRVELVPEFGTALDALIRHHRPAQSINLLQGEFAPAADLRRAWLPWRRAALLAAACVLVAAVGGIADTLSTARAAEAQAAANLVRFRQLYPEHSRASSDNLDALIAAELRALQGGEEPDLLYLLQRFARAMSANQGLSLRGLQWRERALYLNLTGSDLQALERLRNWFAGQSGVVLEVESANAGTGGVQIRLKLTASA